MNISTEITRQFLLPIIISLLLILLVSKLLKKTKLPPGPYGLPFLGYLPFLKDRSHEVFSELAKKYGNIFSINLGTLPYIIINDYQIAKEVLNNPAAYARPDEFGQTFPFKGFPQLNGKAWLEQRRYTVTAMKDLGIGRGHWESLIHNESFEFIKEMKSWKNKPVDFAIPLQFYMANNIISLLVGKRLCHDRESEESKLIMNFADEVIKTVTSTSFSGNMPLFIAKILGKLGLGGFEKTFQLFDDFGKIIQREINSHVASAKHDEEETFIAFYLQELEKEENRKSKNQHFSNNSMIGNLSALFLGAMDTSKASVQWLLLLVAAFPEVQRRIHQEIDDVAGKDRAIYWDERSKFPYLLATINEMQRWVAVAPIFPTRMITEDIEVCGYAIPKGTRVIVNNWGLMRDSKYHKNPDNFNPERFVKYSSYQMSRLDSFIPFSTGKRNCPGEHVANMTVFLFFSSIIQKFQIECPEGKSVILEDRGPGSVRHALPQELCFIER